MKGNKGGTIGKIGKAAGVAPTKNKGALAPRTAGPTKGPYATVTRIKTGGKK